MTMNNNHPGPLAQCQTYERFFEVPACHFNNADTYKMYTRALECKAAGEWSAAAELFEAILHDQHGHDFKIKVTIEYQEGMADDDFFVVDDEALAAVVNEWSHCNITLHEDFGQYEGRVSLERMCIVLANKIASQLIRDKYQSAGEAEVTVEIHETRDIMSSYTVTP